MCVCVCAWYRSTDPTRHLDITQNDQTGPASDLPVEFTYSVKWISTDVSYGDRDALYAQVTSFVRNAHVSAMALTRVDAIL